MEQTCILIIEDEKQIARFLELELTHEGYKVNIAYDGKEGLAKFETGNYDLILLDIMLPCLNGIDVCRRVRKSSNIPIIILTARDEVADRVNGLDNGADDYITKPFAIEELLARIRALLRRKNGPDELPPVLKIGDLILDTSTRQAQRAGTTITFTKREYDLLYYLISNSGVVLSREQILKAVWGYDYYGDTNVVDVYIRYLRSKIDDPFPDKLIHTARGFGYIIREANHEK